MIRGSGEHEAIVEASAMAKSFTMEMARNVGAEAVQIHQGDMPIWRIPRIDWYMRDGKMGEIIGEHNGSHRKCLFAKES